MIFKNKEYFIEIVNEGKINKAAEKLFISQPALSKYLSKLEGNLGISLFERKGNNLNLTEEGKIYYKFIQEYNSLENKYKNELLKLNGKLSGKVSIGMTTWRSQIIFPKLLPITSKRFPNIKIISFEGSHDYLENLFDTNKVDFCIFHLPNKYDGIVYEKIRSEKILLCVNSKDQINNLLSYEYIDGFKEIKSKDFLKFKNSNFIMLKKGQNLRLLTENYLNSLMISPNEIFETSNITTATELVRNGLGITFVPEDMMHTIGYSDDLTFYHIRYSHLNWDICVARRKDRPLTYLSKVIVDTLKEVYGN